ncbi:unnamed protein product [Rotaria sordida]|uniref:Uncharacterized protein n=1 Tax=Rotaria sordida TaxID=392033 RepID=A0A818FY62_9BILA|nr:unnamed protein product [Rotaria sordida]CAF3550347.1 unnamed protein product [Rotaria sordida]
MTVYGIYTINIKVLFICLIILGEFSNLSLQKSGSSSKTAITRSSSKKSTTKKKPNDVLIPPPSPVAVEEQTCYNKSSGAAIRCLPEFVNAAFRRPVVSSNTCGERWKTDSTNIGTEYCIQTGPPHSAISGDYLSGNEQKNCLVCDSRDSSRAHPPSYMTDFNQRENLTWWQSETMLEGINYPNTINLTLNLGKTYDVTYIKLTFQSPKPESFVIYKRTHENTSWVPYQYYSASCVLTFGLSPKKYPDFDTEAICSEDFSDLTPLHGSEVAFGTLDWRPGAVTFEMRNDLQDWVTASEIRIQLVRMNTFGDEMFGQPAVLRTYFYAISDLAVGGRCHCNGHANKCTKQGGNHKNETRCECEHNTIGRDCDMCHPAYNDAPWQPAGVTDAHPCKACVCNGFAKNCTFSRELYEHTGHGSVCIDCAGNRGGPNCERCKLGFYRLPENEGECLSCGCDPIGSEDIQCATNGQCRCKPGVVGDKCDQCAPYHYNFGLNGCTYSLSHLYSRCSCYEPGSLQPLQCNAKTGQCNCKTFAEGQNCDKCRPGFFNLDPMNPDGCTKCFCYGHASTCQSAPNYYYNPIKSSFTKGVDGWRAVNQTGHEVHVYSDTGSYIYVQALPGQDLTFEASPRYLGDRTLSYNQFLTFILILRAPANVNRMYTHADVAIEGANGVKVGVVIYGGVPQTIPSEEPLTFRFRLNEQSWSPTLSFLEFMRLLSNITAIRIHATFGVDNAVSFLGEITLGHSTPSTGLFPIGNIETCSPCPQGYYGERCEYCAFGYRRQPSFGGPFANCVPCHCHNHSLSCDVETGKCACQHHTTGDNCERCLPGYYGQAHQGTPDDCQKCPCPTGVSCTQLQLPQGHVVCLNCPAGYTGDRCEYCDDGYFGDPEGLITGVRRPCELCSCSGNIDPNTIGNCNTTTGHCLRCTRNTYGVYCEKCLPGHWGDALLDIKCHACNCHPKGTQRHSDNSLLQCNLQTGQCSCKSNVQGRQCDRCENGYWNINSDRGCETCKCNPIGAYNISCSVNSGQCFCKPGVTGQNCDRCLPNHYGFSIEGCFPCNCDQYGSLDVQCDIITGQCPCKENFMGQMCDLCEENKYRDGFECPTCPSCYREVQKRVNRYRRDLNLLQNAILTLNSSQTLNSLREDKKLTSELDALANNLNNLKADLQRVGLVFQNTSDYDQQDAQFRLNVTEFEARYRKLERELPEFIAQNDRIRDILQKSNGTILTDTTYQLTRTEKVLSTIAPISYTNDNKHESAINKTVIMQIRINNLHETLKTLQKSYDDALNQSHLAEVLLNTKLGNSEALVRDQLENNMKQRLTSLDLRRQKLVEQSLNLLRRVEEMKIATAEWKSNLTNLSVGQSGLTLDLSNELRERVTKISQDVKKFDDDMKIFVKQMYELQDMSKNFDREMKALQLSVPDTTRETQDLFAKVDQTENKAREAIEKSTMIERDVQKIRENLRAFVQDKDTQSRDAERQYNRLDTMQNRTNDISRQYWILNDQYRLLNKTVFNAMENHEKLKLDHDNNNMIQNSSTIKEQVDAKLIPLKTKTDSINNRSSIALDNIKDIKSQADIHVRRIEKASEIGKNLTNEINSARDQVGKLLEQLKSLQSSLNYSTQINITHLDEVEVEYQKLSLDNIFNAIDQFHSGAYFVKSQSDQFILLHDQLDYQVNNLLDIAQSLPTGCFKTISIENSDATPGER